MSHAMVESPSLSPPDDPIAAHQHTMVASSKTRCCNNLLPYFRPTARTNPSQCTHEHTHLCHKTHTTTTNIVAQPDPNSDILHFFQQRPHAITHFSQDLRNVRKRIPQHLQCCFCRDSNLDILFFAIFFNILSFPMVFNIL